MWRFRRSAASGPAPEFTSTLTPFTWTLAERKRFYNRNDLRGRLRRERLYVFPWRFRKPLLKILAPKRIVPKDKNFAKNESSRRPASRKERPAVMIIAPMIQNPIRCTSGAFVPPNPRNLSPPQRPEPASGDTRSSCVVDDDISSPVPAWSGKGCRNGSTRFRASPSSSSDTVSREGGIHHFGFDALTLSGTSDIATTSKTISASLSAAQADARAKLSLVSRTPTSLGPSSGSTPLGARPATSGTRQSAHSMNPCRYSVKHFGQYNFSLSDSA